MEPPESYIGIPSGSTEWTEETYLDKIPFTPRKESDRRRELYPDLDYGDPESPRRQIRLWNPAPSPAQKLRKVHEAMPGYLGLYTPSPRDLPSGRERHRWAEEEPSPTINWSAIVRKCARDAIMRRRRQQDKHILEGSISSGSVSIPPNNDLEEYSELEGRGLSVRSPSPDKVDEIAFESKEMYPKLSYADYKRDLSKKRMFKPLAFEHDRTINIERYVVFNIGQRKRREMWGDLKVRLQPEVYGAIVKMQIVQQPNGNPRCDLWIEARMASGLKKAMGLDSKSRRNGTQFCPKLPIQGGEGDADTYTWHPNKRTSQWRLDYYRPWRERFLPGREKTPPPHVQAHSRRNIMTLNVNGIWGKRTQLDHLLEMQHIGIAALQETLIDGKARRLAIRGYTLYQKEKDGGFRGQALAIHKDYPSYRIDDGESNHIIHVRVTKYHGTVPWHIIAVYYPSGGNCKRKRTDVLREVLAIYKKIVTKDRTAPIVILGDHNMPRSEVEKRVRTVQTGLKCLAVAGSNLTFKRTNSKWSNIDHILVSPQAESNLGAARVGRFLNVGSDHFPLITKPKIQVAALPTPPIKTRRFDTDLLKGHGKQLVNSPLWNKILNKGPHISYAMLMDTEAKEFCDTVNKIGDEMGTRKPIVASKPLLPRQIAKGLNTVYQLNRKFEDAWAKGASQATIDRMHARLKEKKQSVDKRVKDWQNKRRVNEVVAVTAMQRQGEMKRFHQWEQRTIGKGKAATGVHPVKDKQGELQTSQEGIMRATFEHYKSLNQDDPEQKSGNPDFWRGKATDRREETMTELNEPVGWQEILMTIRQMALGTAAGHDGIPIEVYKAMLREENAKATEKALGDNIIVALPEEDLPTRPLTNMGKALNRLIQGIWEHEQQPEYFSRVTNVSLYKSGDPSEMKNYRGISLISVAMKIVTALLARRLSTSFELNDVIMPEQGGFRSKEEAIGQFISLSEVVRRRRIKGMKTYIIFIDLLKAFDKVMHEALFEKLEAIGVRGKMLKLLQHIYRTSKACYRVGTEHTEYYDMTRGVRQGCPLSPILFSLYINDIQHYLPKGVSVPNIKGLCPGFFFADDIAGAVEGEKAIQIYLDGLSRWTTDWDQPANVDKCGIMLVGGTEQEQADLKEKQFFLYGKPVPIVESYKYLGIIITPAFGDKDKTDEVNHCKLLAHRVTQATRIRMGFLRDPAFPLETKLAVITSKIIPLGTYGGEWVGMCRKRTNIIQTAVNNALKVILGSSSKSRLHANQCMAWELNVPTIETRMAELRNRLLMKAPELKTWIATLSDPKNRFVDRSRTWTSQTRHWLKTTHKYETGTMPPWLDQAMLERGKTTEEKVREERYPLAQILAVKAIGASLSEGCASFIKYSRWQFAMTRSYIRAAAHRPKYAKGVIWLARVRTNAWWSGTRRLNYLKAKKLSGGHLEGGKCASCNKPIAELEEIVHILLACPVFERERDMYLKGHLALFLRPQAANGFTFRMDTNEEAKNRDLEVAMRLLGAVPNPHESDMPRNPRYRVIPDSTPIDLYTRAWAGNPHTGYALEGSEEPPFYTIARFLEAVMPHHMSRVHWSDKPGPSRNLFAYSSDEDEVTPVKNNLRQRLDFELGQGLVRPTDEWIAKQQLTIQNPVTNPLEGEDITQAKAPRSTAGSQSTTHSRRLSRDALYLRPFTPSVPSTLDSGSEVNSDRTLLRRQSHYMQ